MLFRLNLVPEMHVLVIILHIVHTGFLQIQRISFVVEQFAPHVDHSSNRSSSFLHVYSRKNVQKYYNFLIYQNFSIILSQENEMTM